MMHHLWVWGTHECIPRSFTSYIRKDPISKSGHMPGLQWTHIWQRKRKLPRRALEPTFPEGQPH